MMKHLAIHWEGSLKEVTRSLALLESDGTELFLRDTHSAIEVPDTRIYSTCAAVDWSMTLGKLSRSGAADSCTRLKANNFPSTRPHYLLSLSIFHKHNWGYHPCPWHSTAVPLLSNLVSTHRTLRHYYYYYYYYYIMIICTPCLTLKRLMSYIYIYIYIYGAPILDVSSSHTTTQHSR